MKKIVCFLFCLTMATLFFASSALAIALGTNITIPDGLGGATFSTGSVPSGYNNIGGEDNEVEPGCVANQSWDMEAFYLNDSKLTMVGGFDMVNGNGINPTFKSGDIFIDVNNNARYGALANDNTGGSYQKVNNNFGYEYVMDVDFSSKTFDLYKLTGELLLVEVYYAQNEGSNPLRRCSGGELIGSYGFAYSANLPDDLNEDGKAELLGQNHNAAVFDLSFLQNNIKITDFTGGFTSHFTMGCGNDNLMGKGTIPTAPVPEPATLLLLGSGLLGLAGFRKKNK